MFYQHCNQLLRRHLTAVYLASFIGFTIIILSIFHGTFIKAFMYLLAMCTAFLVSEYIYSKKEVKFTSIVIKSPFQEFSVLAFIQLAGLSLLLYRFSFIDDFSNLGKHSRIILVSLRLLIMYPILLLIYFLIIKRYKLVNLGFRFKYWFVAVPIIFIIGIISFACFPEGLQFEEQSRQNLFISMITLGFLTAAIPEELMRYLFQTRASQILGNKSLGWIIASFVWALLHIPSFSRGDSTMYDGAIHAFGILPIGLLWGYLNQRFQSIIPSVLIHGTNLWGLQNIF